MHKNGSFRECPNGGVPYYESSKVETLRVLKAWKINTKRIGVFLTASVSGDRVIFGIRAVPVPVP